MKTTRRFVQTGFLALIVTGVWIVGGNAERWCPFGGVEAIYSYVSEGNLICSLGVSNFYILGGVLLTVLVLKRAFCGYACPIGALSEWIQAGAVKLGIRPARVSPALDRVLSLLKYLALAVVLAFTWKVGEIVLRGYGPCYALISRHGKDITFWAYALSGAVAAGSLFLTVPFCRWLCPLAALLNPFSRFAPARIRRNSKACVDCALCAKACVMAIPVDKEVEVTAARCSSCLDCVDVCPERDRGALVWGTKRSGWSQTTLVAVLLLCFGGAVTADILYPLPSFVWTRGDVPYETAGLEMIIEGVTCRGKSAGLTVWLQRDDELEVEGFIKVETWPGPGSGRVRITFDPFRTSDEAIRKALTDPWFDLGSGGFDMSPYLIEEFDSFGSGGKSKRRPEQENNP